MHGRRDDPADAERDSACEDGGGDVPLLDDLLPQVEGGDLREGAESGDEEAYAEAGEDQGVHDGDIGHSARIKLSRAGLA